MSKAKRIRREIKSLSIAFVIFYIFTAFFFSQYRIPSSSMEPTLYKGDRIFVQKYSYGYSFSSLPFVWGLFPNKTTRIFNRTPQRGEVVTFARFGKKNINVVKRLIGLPGDVVEMVGGMIVLNGTQITEDQSFRKERRMIPVDGHLLEYCIESFYENIEGRKYVVNYVCNDSEEGQKKHQDIFDKGISLRRDYSIFRIPEDYFFVMGDNRDFSLDSRAFDSFTKPLVHRSELIGKVFHVFRVFRVCISPCEKYPLFTHV